MITVSSTRHSFRAQQVQQQSNQGGRAKHEQQRAMLVKKRRYDVYVSAQVVRSQTPAACPQESAGGVVRSEGPPRHPQNPGDDPVQLPQAVEKSGQQNYHTAAALEKIIEVLLSMRVDLELVQGGPAA